MGIDEVVLSPAVKSISPVEEESEIAALIELFSCLHLYAVVCLCSYVIQMHMHMPYDTMFLCGL